MSETANVSPLLDGFAMGNPISEHHGIRCCPAIKENTDKKYIVKVLTIPASQVQLDALLLAGAFRDASGAMEYFRDQAEGVLKEAELLKKLSKLDGFLSYEGWQMEPITRYRLGYEIYLLGSYKRSLDKYMKQNAITHQEAIHLGMDMCAALSVARQAGYLYVDLKPTNIFLSDKKEYRLGDLGFLNLKELRYSALPEKYHSSYTAPELYDPMNSVNLTADTYALGMLLYQLYNDGTLPFKGKAPEEALPNPVHADYELAEIIMKAIHPDHTQRWTDPKEMGKALASYLQRNEVGDTAITPLRIRKSKSKKKQTAAEAAPVPAEEAAPETAAEETILTEAAPAQVLPAEEEASAEVLSGETPAAEEASDPEPTDEDQMTEPEPPEGEHQEEPEPEPEADAEQEMPEETPEEAPQDEEPQDDDAQEDDARQEDAAADPDEAPVTFTGDLARIMEKADALIAHELPQMLIVEEPEDPFAFAAEDEETPEEYEDEEEESPAEPEDTDPRTKKKAEKKFARSTGKKLGKKLLSLVVVLGILAALAFGGLWYYQNLYLQNVRSITIDADQTQMQVTVDSDIPDEKLLLTCISSVGTADTATLSGGKALFTGLTPNTMYTVKLEIDGFHALTGQTSQTYTTEATTNIASFTSVAGPEDGSVILDFTVDGDEPPFWSIHYGTEGEETLTETFTGHTLTINGLTLGKVYTFTLDAGENRSLSGQYTLERLASRLILAENLSVVSSNGGDMTVRWDIPGDIVVDSWSVRCYSPMGYDQQHTVTENQVLFTGIDPSLEYTIEVTASGMTQPARTGITANPIQISNFACDTQDADTLQLSWEFTGSEPEDGWLLLYSVDGGQNHVVKCAKAAASVSPKIPGAKYTFSIQAADGTTIFNSAHSAAVEDAAPYEGNALKQEMLTADLVKTPDEKNWHFETLGEGAIATEFAVGDPISIVLRSNDTFYLPGYNTKILYVVRDSYGNVLSPYVTEETVVWKSIWTGGDAKTGELEIPSLPTNPGEYRIDLYFSGMMVAQLPFTLS